LEVMGDFLSADFYLPLVWPKKRVFDI